MESEILDRLIGAPLPLSLRDCVVRALSSNPDILVTSYDPSIAEADLFSSRGQFDPVLSGGATLTDSTTPPSPLQFAFGGFTESIEDRSGDFNLQLGGQSGLGTQYTLDMRSSRQSGTFTGDISVYSTNIGLTLTQPILRGFGLDSNLATIRTAERGLGIADAQLHITILQSIGNTIKAYWDLVGAIELLDVRRESFDNAMRLLRINEQRLDIGTAAAIEVLQAKANASTRQGDLVTARTAILNSEDTLKNLIGMQNGHEFSSENIVPVDRPGTRQFDWDMEESMKKSVDNRPEVRTAKLQLENAEIEAKRARNELRPQVDITGSFRPNAQEFDFNRSLDGALQREGRTWSVGIVGSIPLGNRTAKGNYRRSKLSIRKQEQTITKVEQDVMLAARTSLRNVLNSQILVEANHQARILEEANAAAEERRLLLGVTTTQTVLDRQEDLTIAQLNELQATIGFEKALVDLRMAEGVLLTELGIDYEDYMYEYPETLE